MAIGLLQKVYKISGISKEHKNSVPARKALVFYTAAKKKKGRCPGYDVVEAERSGIWNRGYQGRCSDDKKKIENIAAYNIPDGNICLSFSGGSHRSKQFWE